MAFFFSVPGLWVLLDSFLFPGRVLLSRKPQRSVDDLGPTVQRQRVNGSFAEGDVINKTHHVSGRELGEEFVARFIAVLPVDLQLQEKERAKEIETSIQSSMKPMRSKWPPCWCN